MISTRQVCDRWRTYDDIVDHCSDAWNKLAARPWTIMSIGMRDRAHEF